MRFGLFFAFLLLCSTASASVHAATLTASGATNVEVDGKLYDVSYLDGTCAAVFDGCDEVSDFTFTDEPHAILASIALYDLFHATGNEAYNENPSLTDGCEGTQCWIFTPHYVGADGFFDSTHFGNVVISSLDFISFSAGRNDEDFFLEEIFTWARWTPVAPIPVPAGLPLALSGLAFLAGLRRMKKKRVAQV